MDVAFDQQFLSGISGTSHPFSQSQPERNIGKVGGPKSTPTETTGDITNLTDTQISHWGSDNTFEVDHQAQSISTPNPYHILEEDSDSEESSSPMDASTSSSDDKDNDSANEAEEGSTCWWFST